MLGVLLVGFARECAIHSVDFPVYHRTARQLIAGNFELYPTAVYKMADRCLPHEFRYAPVIRLLLFVPFGFLPLELAALVFFDLKEWRPVCTLPLSWRDMRDCQRLIAICCSLALLLVGG